MSTLNVDLYLINTDQVNVHRRPISSAHVEDSIKKVNYTNY